MSNALPNDAVGPAAGKAGLGDFLHSLTLTVGRGPVAEMMTDLAAATPEDRLLDVGCGPGAAVRAAARRGADATGIDPSRSALSIARFITRRRGIRNAAFLEGTAEAIPLADGAATVAWAISSTHHWSDVDAGLAELHRVLAPGGRILLAERLTPPGATGHSAEHGMNVEKIAALEEKVASAGFRGVRSEQHRAGRRTLAVVIGTR